MTPSTVALARALRSQISGDVWDDDVSRNRYARDFSIFQTVPQLIVAPRDTGDIVKTIVLARDAGVPVTARGGGTSTGGCATGSGIVILLNRLCGLTRLGDLSVDGSDAVVTAEAGVVHDALQTRLREHGFFLPADPSSGAISFIGGNVSTKASGPHALKYGSIDRYLQHVTFVTAEGGVIDTADTATIPAELAEGIRQLRQQVSADLESVALLERRRDMKCASGYNLGAMLGNLTDGELLAQCLVGSVGTLGIVVNATIRGQAIDPGRATTLLCFRSLEDAGDAVQAIRDSGVAAIEIMNSEAVRIVRERHPELPLPDGEAHILLVEYSGATRHEQVARVESHLRDAGYDMAAPSETVDGEGEQDTLWRARKALLPLIRNYRSDRQAWPVVNDVGVDPVHLGPFIHDVQNIFKRFGLMAPIYGHAGSGNLHLRPFFNPSDPDVPNTVQRVADEVYATAFKYGGTITAEHGMGRARAPYLEREWGPEMVAHMRSLKHLFDPAGHLNPGVMFGDGRQLADGIR